MIAQYLFGGREMEGALVLGFILNIISMIACPIIGGNKGRSVVGWFFGGLFLSVIGLNRILLKRDSQRKELII